MMMYFECRKITVQLSLAAIVVANLAGVALAAEEFTVKAVTVDDRKAVFATVETINTTDARSRIGGTVTELTIDEGSAITAGQVIARVVDPKLSLRLKAIEARMSSVRSQRDLAKTALDRAVKLRAKGATSQARLDQAETDLTVLQRDLIAMRAESAVIAEQRAEGAVKAPTDGRVMAVRVTTGKVVLPGDSIAAIAADAYILRLRLPERHARFIAIGDQVIVGSRDMSDRPEGRRPGKIRQVYPEMRQGRVIADVEVAGLGVYFIGERVRVHVATGRRRAYIIPKQYIYHRHGLTYVSLKDGGEIVVQPGLAQIEGIEILSGLGDGDVLTMPPAKVSGQ